MSTPVKSLKPFFDLAIRNIKKYSDTDIFPLPLENLVLSDRKDRIVNLLCEAFKKFDVVFAQSPPQNIRSLVPVGNTGFRWAAQLDPFWNAYLLGIVLALADKIEASRLPPSAECVFSYRTKIDHQEDAVFSEEFGFREFLRTSRELASEYSHIVISDISDCYSRISHHQIENALQQAKCEPDLSEQVLSILKDFSNDKSYGVPVGGPAARILVELVLGLTDKLLKQHGYRFCRFADDYHIFAKSESESFQALLFLSERLARNEGLSLQKSKTRIVSSSEFLSTPDLFSIEEDPKTSQPLKSLLQISLRFDPYSANPEDDYEKLKAEIKKVDLIHLLNVEFAKSRIHAPFTKRIVRAVRHASNSVKNAAALTLLENLDALYPIFPSVAITLKGVFEDLEEDVQTRIEEKLCQLILENHPLILSEVHLAFAVRVLGQRKTSLSTDIMVKIFKDRTSELIRKDIITIMANWEEYSWLFDLKNIFTTLSLWERRAFVVATYRMGDSGKHWRKGHKGTLSEFENEVLGWASAKKEAQPHSWKVPL